MLSTCLCSRWGRMLNAVGHCGGGRTPAVTVPGRLYLTFAVESCVPIASVLHKMKPAIGRDEDFSAQAVHYLPESEEQVCLAVTRLESGAWKAHLRGRGISIAEHFDSAERAREEVLGWFQRSFIFHACNPRCRLQSLPATNGRGSTSHLSAWGEEATAKGV